MRFVTLSSLRLGSMGDDGGIGFRARSPGVRAHRSRPAVTVFLLKKTILNIADCDSALYSPMGGR